MAGRKWHGRAVCEGLDAFPGGFKAWRWRTGWPHGPGHCLAARVRIMPEPTASGVYKRAGILPPDVRRKPKPSKAHPDLMDRELDRALRSRPGALADFTRRESDPMRYIDSSSIPYLILGDPPGTLGDQAIVLDPHARTLCHAIIGENPPDLRAGASLALSQALGLQGATDRECILILFPGTSLGPGFMPSLERVATCGQSLWNRSFPGQANSPRGWGDILNPLFDLEDWPEDYRDVTPSR